MNLMLRKGMCLSSQEKGRISLSWFRSGFGREIFRAVDFCGLIIRPVMSPKLESI